MKHLDVIRNINELVETKIVTARATSDLGLGAEKTLWDANIRHTKHLLLREIEKYVVVEKNIEERTITEPVAKLNTSLVVMQEEDFKALLKEVQELVKILMRTER